MTPPPTLLGTYSPPLTSVGRRVWCRYRSAWCRITSFTDAPISWPRCIIAGQRGGSGLWVSAGLERAIHTESALALRHWFGVSRTCVNCWRRWAGVEGHLTTRGSIRERQRISELGAEVVRGTKQSDEERAAKSKRSKALDLIRHARAKRWPNGWTPEMDARLGTAPDIQLAWAWGKSETAVRMRRGRLRIAACVEIG